MKTKLLYLDDSYLKSMKAKVIEVNEITPKLYALVLDQTVFYPIGGGQATDQGKMVSKSWEGKVQEVVIKNGEVSHFVHSQTAPIAGDKVNGEIDWNRRYRLMRIHSAGHIIDFAMYLLGYSPGKLKPFKGDHGKRAFILYQGTLDKDIKQELLEKANELVAKDLEITWKFVDFIELEKEAIYLQPGLPTNKPLRMITLEEVGSVADGGTQVKQTSEIGKIEVPAIEILGETTKV